MNDHSRVQIPISKEKWDSFLGKQQWDVMCALRGPDCDDEMSTRLKWFSTSVIRGYMRDCIRVGGAVNREDGQVTLPLKFSASPFWFSHFLSHIKDAAAVLEIPVVRKDY